MSKKDGIVNQFVKGLHRDSLPERQPDSTYTYALNLMNGSTEHLGTLVNEDSNIKFNASDFDGTIVGVSHFAKIDQSVVFVAGEGSSLYLVHHHTGEVIKIMTDSDFGCDWGFGECEMLYGELKLMQPCNDRMLYFSSKCDYWRVNIDEVLSDRKKCIDSCEHFKLFRCICTPKASMIPVEGGGWTRAGAYWVSLQLEDNDGNTTNWFAVQGPVYLGGENNIAGEITNQSIRIFVDAIDEGYDKVNIAVIKRIRGITSAEIIVSRPHASTAFTFDYTGDNANAEEILIDEILNKGKKFIQGSDLFQKDGILYLYGIKQEFNPNYQPYANAIRTRMVEFEVTAETQKQYNLPTLMRDEVYGVVGWLNYCDGTKSVGFHVPAGAEGNPGPVVAQDSYMATSGGQLVTPSSTPIAMAPGQSVLPYGTPTLDDWNTSTWIQGSGPGISPETGPNEGDYTLAKSTGNLNEQLSSLSPALDLTGSVGAVVSFEHYMFGSDVDRIQLQASTDGKSWATVWERSGNQGTGWMPGSASLNAYSGSWIQLRLLTTPTGNQGDIAIRNLQVVNNEEEVPTGAHQYTGDYDTSGVFSRTRGTADTPETPLEEALAADLDNLNCDIDKAAEGTEKFAEFFGVDEICSDDFSVAANMVENVAEEEAEFAQDETDPTLNQTTSIKEAAKNLYEKAVKDREEEHYGKPSWDTKKGRRYQASTDNKDEAAPRNDRWTDARGRNLMTEVPRIINIFEPDVYTSEIPYPDICDCNGNRMFPEGGIRHHRAPTNCESTHYISNQVGVPSKQDPVNSPLGDTYIRLLGFEFQNIYVPSYEKGEIPKPLCPHTPITFGILKRDLNDRSIIAKGLLVPTFTGQVRGREHAMGKHGVSSFETVDVAIDNDGSKIGINDSPAAYLFHSLDTSCQRIPLTVDSLSPQLELFGSGWRYGLYAEGEKPEQWFTGKQVDQRGARQAVSLMAQACNNADEETREISGITYAPANSVVTPPKGINLPLNNRFRESSVYLQLDSKMPPLTQGIGPESDASFVGDVLDHSCPIGKASAWYVSLKRELKSQYGSVDSQKAISTGISTLEAAEGTYTSVMGITGDVFIGMHSIKRSGYVSDKVGDEFPVQNGSDDGRGSQWKKPRTICDHPADFNIQNLGIEHYSTRFPKDGDVSDAKNWAGLHTTSITYSCGGAAARTAPDSDYYYPRLQKTLVTYIGEFEVNPWKRATGEGLQKVEGQVYYPALRDLELDSSFSEDIPWPEAWLNRFYVEVEQPSKAVLAKKVMIRTMLALIIPAIGLLITTQLESIPDTLLTIVILPMLTFYWTYAKTSVFTDDWINKMLGIPICKTDEGGGENYVRVRGFEDNYCKYYSDFSQVNIFEYALGIPSNYNTCVCNECNALVTREVYYSNKQVETSIVDSYKNFQAHDYSNIPAHAGPLLKLFVESNRFYGHTTDGLWILQYNNVTAQYEGITTILGRGDLLRDPQQVSEGPTEGYLGLADRNAGIHCEAGYVFVSRPSSSIVLISGGKVEVISSAGMSNFFRENTRFCGAGDCIDERAGLDFVLGYDPRFKRILVTKRDSTSEASWTISYHLLTKTWTSFHSYLPKFYVWDQDNMFSIHDDSFWIHNVQSKLKGNARTWCNFYGVTHPIKLDFPARQESATPWQYQHTLFDLEVRIPKNNDWLRGRHIFFDEIGVWNRTQSTGMLPIEKPVRTDNPSTENDVPSRMKGRKDRVTAVYAGDEWRVNGLTDHVKGCNGEVTKRVSICSSELILIDQGDKTGGQENLTDRYLFYRLVANDPNKYQMYIKSVVSVIAIQSE